MGFLRLAIWNALPNGKRAQLVDVAPYYEEHMDEYAEDLPFLLKLLKDGSITPTISHELALKDAAQAMQLLLDKQARGKVVLLSEG